MRKAGLFLAVIVSIAGLSGSAFAGSQTYGFDNGYWGFNGDAGYVTWYHLEENDGNPAPSIRIKGMSGFGLEVTRPEFVGDFAAAGYGRLRFDLKIINWFPQAAEPNPPLRIFMQRANDRNPWVKVASGFSSIKGQWQQVSVDFNPNWTDAQAQAAGWSIEPFGLTNATFQDTCRNIFATGAWLKIQGPLYEGYYLIDNYSLLPPGGGGTKPLLKTLPLERKQMTFPKDRLPRK